MTPPTKPEIAAAFEAASELYDTGPLRFWDHFGARAVDRAALHPGEHVLDVCCGAGASAVPAAHAVAPGGRVTGVDLTPAMLDLARAKAAGCGVTNIAFQQGDFDSAELPPGSFDAVVCVFGLFFFPDMPGALRKMWSLVRPGGRLVIVTWGAGAFEPAHTLFLDALHRERPDLAQVNSPRVRLTDPSELGRVFAAAGVTGVEIASEDAGHQLASAEDWWTIVMGTAHRGRVDRLAPDQRDRVRRACLTLTARTLQMPALFALARK